jgi:hypothetical protein
MTLWYVSSAVGSSGNGTSWALAWKAFANIVWGSINPGDTIWVDGGTAGLTYTDRLLIGASGTAGNPITIAASTAAGHNRPVLSDGGRVTPLPYASQATGSWTETAVRFQGISFQGNSYVVVDGSVWHGWKVFGGKYNGIDMGVGASNNTIRNFEIYDNGTGTSGADGWTTDRPGIQLVGDNHTVDHCDIHDNGQDNFQTGTSTNHLTVTNTWMHYTRENPNYPGYAFNQNHPPNYDSGAGTHQDGYQIYGDTPITDLNFTDCLFGPGLMQGTILQATTSAITIRQCLFFPTTNGTAIMGYPSIAATTWTIDHVTTVAATTQGNLWLEGTSMTITNSIFYGGRIELDHAPSTTGGVIQFNTNTITFPSSLTNLDGTTVDPNFVTNVSGWASTLPIFSQLLSANLAPTAGAALGKGCTDFTSVQSFLNFIGASGPVLGLFMAHA